MSASQAAIDFVKKLINDNQIPSEIRINKREFHDAIFNLANAMIASNIKIDEIGDIIENLSNEKYFGKTLYGNLLVKAKVKGSDYQSQFNGTLLSAFKIAKAKLAFNEAKTKVDSCHLTVIIPMYGEQDRILPMPNGQDFVREKYRQLQWLFGESDGLSIVTTKSNNNSQDDQKNNNNNNSKHTWNIIFMDDGDYENASRFDAANGYKPKYLSSFELAQNVIFEHGLTQARSLKLGDVIARYNVAKQARDKENASNENKASDEKEDINGNGIFWFKDITNPAKGSRRGGAVAYGKYVAITEHSPKDKNTRHIVMTSDSDLSMHLGQAGTLIAEVLTKDGTKMCVGARYGLPGSYLGYPDGVVVNYAEHFGPNRVRILMRHILRGLLIPSLKRIYDTQVPLKVFDADVIPTILSTAKDRASSFEIELLLLVSNKYGDNSIGVSGVYFTEDFESSKFTLADNPGAYYFGQVKNILSMYEQFIKPHRPIKSDGSEKDREIALKYAKELTNERFNKEWTFIEKTLPGDAFLAYPLTLQNIIDPSTLTKKKN